MGAARGNGGRGALAGLSGLAGLSLIGSCLDELADPWKIIDDAERLAEMGVAAPILATALLTYIQVSVGILLLRPAIRTLFPRLNPATAKLELSRPALPEASPTTPPRWPLGGKVIDLDQRRTRSAPDSSPP